MYFKTAVAAFFLHISKTENLDSLAQKAGLTDLKQLHKHELLGFGIIDHSYKILYGHWDGFGDVWVKIDSINELQCLQIYFSRNRFLDKTEISDNFGLILNDNLDLPMVETFKTACKELNPITALIDIRTHYGDDDWEINLGSSEEVLKYSSKIEGGYADELLNEGLSLLFLSKEIPLQIQDNENTRDIIATGNGQIIFAGKGLKRWF